MGQPVADRQGEGMNVSPRKKNILFNASVPLLNTYPGADIKRLYPRNVAYIRCMKKSLITKPLTVYCTKQSMSNIYEYFVKPC